MPKRQKIPMTVLRNSWVDDDGEWVDHLDEQFDQVERIRRQPREQTSKELRQGARRQRSKEIGREHKRIKRDRRLEHVG